ncbi:hypothetical protein ACFCX0_27130 [Streptomyces sp. NPDC056352]|uniref:hypothetical protein n=1 Tax=Streptomyces sp. NPDC056352 TaxID=3345791 RepID=UPI0035D71495
MTDVMAEIEAGEAAVDALDAVDDGLVAELVARAQAAGVKLTGEGGLLAELTRKVLEGELTDHLGHEPGERAEGGRENYRNVAPADSLICPGGSRCAVIFGMSGAGPCVGALAGVMITRHHVWSCC